MAGEGAIMLGEWLGTIMLREWVSRGGGASGAMLAPGPAAGRQKVAKSLGFSSLSLKELLKL